MSTNRFQNAVNKLIKSFFNETLTKGKCTRCAVGNICGSWEWSVLFETDPNTNEQDTSGLNRSKFMPEQFETALKQIYDTNYTPEELAKVEYVFETNTKIAYLDYEYNQCTHEEFIQDQFNGLCAVIDVLCEFEGQDPEVYKSKLREKPEVEV